MEDFDARLGIELGVEEGSMVPPLPPFLRVEVFGLCGGKVLSLTRVFNTVIVHLMSRSQIIATMAMCTGTSTCVRHSGEPAA